MRSFRNAFAAAFGAVCEKGHSLAGKHQSFLAFYSFSCPTQMRILRATLRRMESPSPYQDNNPLLNLSFDFAIAVIAYCELLQQLRKYEMARQLFKSGTSIHAQVREAQHPESKADFIHKLKIGMKEASETEGWLLMCLHAPSYPDPIHLVQMLGPIQKILSRIIGNSRGGT